ncbi:MAG: MBL fold metallo-hydrolase [Longispora sp.]|nr:MBL fold metallo-hydrolase [Longispora sp. (in: high G+C Gram-positive bacteria)]
MVRIWPRSFAHRLSAPLPTYRDFARLLLRDGLHPRGRSTAGVPEIPVNRLGLPKISDPRSAVTWVGHATFVIRIRNMTILTDPVWSRRIPATPARWTAPGVDWSDLPTVDAVVISHNHYDHLDAPTIKRLPRDTPVFVPGGLGRWFRKRGFTEVTELDWWESAKVHNVRLDFVPAHHWSRRGLLDTCRSLWGGWVIDQKVYFAGDTGYGPYFREIGQRHPNLELAIMPIGAYDPRWIMHTVHMNPEEAVTALGDLGASRMAPMHWGTFGLTTEPVLEPIQRARTAWAATGRPRADLWDLAVGESAVW